MFFNVYSFSLIFSILFLVIIIVEIKKGNLLEKYSLFWIFFSIVMIVISANLKFLNLLSRMLHIYYAPSVLFLLGLLFIISYCFHLTLIISKQTESIVKLTQEVAILKNMVENVSRDVEGGKGD
ncbi:MULTISPECIES: DUF2304 domain-containing protein [Thermoanaerobacterium]|uniref:DUF2304 domain-containing protein n=2 Tax=Thermoanaerobacterium TaxID=28895 RepID=W9EBG2_9THEO|nr:MULTISPECIES: DUF2304 domain-containing protein [Thermoanaerobacterium]AFK85383.1 hypothetical protein Tsac_0353 [Thermoanaerobacterium saccharolyticum JW/SL-YS485]ETO39448.1 hypothetical protein V518_0382 [Thermoanaerobacterium aotearoense SCUT27]